MTEINHKNYALCLHSRALELSEPETIPVDLKKGKIYDFKQERFHAFPSDNRLELIVIEKRHSVGKVDILEEDFSPPCTYTGKYMIVELYDEPKPC